MTIRRVKSALGDVFAIPLVPKIENYSSDGKGEYLPEDDELFVIAQFVFESDYEQCSFMRGMSSARTMMCFGRAVNWSSIEPDMATEIVLHSSASVEFKTTDYFANRSWWKKITTSEISPFLPYQTYSFYSDEMIDYQAVVTGPKSVVGLREVSSSVAGAMAENICAQILGIKSAGYHPDFDFGEYVPSEDKSVWNTFPERYVLDQESGLLFDGVPVKEIHEGRKGN